MKTKLKSIKAILSIVIFTMVANFANAQQRPPEPPPIPDSTQINDMVSHMVSDLGLNKEQAEKIRMLHFEHFNKFRGLQEKEKVQMDAMRQEHEKLKKEFDEQLKKELTKEQFEKHQKRMEEMRKKDNNHRPK